MVLAAALLPPGAAGESLPANPAGSPPGIDLLHQYPTTLTAGDTAPERARVWEFTSADIFRLSHFRFEAGKDLRIETGVADLGIGHGNDGAVWAVVMPRQNGELTSSVTNPPEAVAHVWLRFHPGEIKRLFPPDTVSPDGATNLMAQMRRIANHKLTSSWHAGNQAMIPEPKDMTVDVDTKDGPRRFFIVDTAAQTAEYVPAFANRAVKPPPAITAEAAQTAFDQLWESFDRDYAMFVLRPEVDWAKLREQYRPKALGSQSTSEFAEVCAEMLKPLRDLHVWLTVAEDNVPIFNRPRAANANPSAHQVILGNLHQEDRRVQWAVTDDRIGFIAIYGWNDPNIPALCQAALEKMRDTRGLIVDVRLNGGGSEDQAMEFAGRFLKEEFVYAYSQSRNGPSHTNLTQKTARKVSPRGPWRYDRPVVLLIGQECMSSNESFIGMMTGDPEVTTMGDHTCGSSGNPEIINLPLEMTVSVPQWIDYLPDGTPLDEHGFQPQVPFTPSAGAFEGSRDDLLLAALERLRQAPLPDKPMAGPAFVSDETAEAQDDSRPKVISVFPVDGAQFVEPASELRVRFDRPMDPLALKLNWKSGGILDCEFPSYDSQKHQFTIPVRMAQGMGEQIEVNEPILQNLDRARAYYPRDGFQSADHRLARVFTWKFKTRDAATVAGDQPPKVLKISPSPGSVVPYRTFLEVQFDQPMKPPAEALPYLIKGTGSNLKEATLICHVEYDAASHTFRLPMLLFPKEKSTFTLQGFYGETGAPSAPVRLEYQVSDQALAPEEQERFEAAARSPRLLAALASMQKGRAELHSLAERIQCLYLYASGQGSLFQRLRAQSATYRWQQSDRFYADITEMMGMDNAFVIGSDGQDWWWHLDSAFTNIFQVCPVNERRRLDISLCDPFDLTHEATGQAVSKWELNYLGDGNFDGARCRMLEGWSIEKLDWLTPIGSLNQWWIDAKTGRPLGIRQFSGGFMMRTRFLYDAVNRALPSEDFAIPKVTGLSPRPAEALDAGYTNRLVIIRDGGDGRPSVRWGKEGPKGRASSGLN